ncbi:MAG: tRNA (adenosine(37)-N6)-threonylcarbamoyltransferase complex ATPase subunit type 1 TsaE [Patescibacteria group bacterium]
MSQKPKTNHAIVIGLEGELGSGKTTFVQKFAKALGITEHITSPTFVILKKYGNLVHIDAYRLKSSEDLKKLGIQELIEDPRNIIFIEWADLVADILPNDRITIHFEHVSEGKRKISID